ncbi:MAG: DUF4232 domain-containing protein [Jatrophihabitantaceae bacterium]
MNRRPALLGALVAITLGCAACTSAATPAHKPPNSSSRAGTQSTIHSTPTPPAHTTTPPAHTTTPPTTGSTTTAPPVNTVAAGWIAHADFKDLPHPDLGCANAQEGNRVEVTKVVSADVTGDGAADAIVRMDCLHAASEWPDWVFVYSDTSGHPKVVATLITNRDSTYVPTISTSDRTVTLGLLTWSRYAAGCCADLHYTQQFIWTGSGFDRGSRQDVLAPCGDTAFTVSTADGRGAAGHGSLVVEFRNRLPQACTVYGYPGLDALNSAGTTLAHAARTLHGMAGGARSESTVRVEPGRSASALVEWSNVPPGGGSCATSWYIAVTPANTEDTHQLRASVSTCKLQIHPTVPGTTGNG